MSDLKICSKCGEEKGLGEFYKDKRRAGKSGHTSRCKSCERGRMRVESMSREQLEGLRERKREYYRAKGRTEKDLNRDSEYKREYRRSEAYLKEGLIRRRERQRRRRAEDPMYRVKHNLSERLRGFLKSEGYSKNTKTTEILGCDLGTLKAHIESKFWPGMNWGNYGEWQIDHIKPLASAENIEDVYRLNHYSNLQPLWMIDNIRKGAKHIDLWPRSSSIVTLTETG